MQSPIYIAKTCHLPHCEHGGVLQVLFLPIAVPSIVETHTEKSLRSMEAVMSGAVITTQYSTVEFMPSVTVLFIGGSIPIVSPVK